MWLQSWIALSNINARNARQTPGRCHSITVTVRGARPKIEKNKVEVTSDEPATATVTAIWLLEINKNKQTNCTFTVTVTVTGIQ